MRSQMVGPSGDAAVVNPDGSQLVQLMGSNVEAASGQPAPAKAILIGGKAASGNMQLPRVDPTADGHLDDNVLFTQARLMQYNDSDSKYYRVRGNTQGTLLASQARTTQTASPNQTNYNAKGVHITINVTAISGTPVNGLTILVVGVSNNGSSTYVINPTPPAITSVGKQTIEIYPGVGGISGEVRQRTSASLPRTWYVLITDSDGAGVTYTYSVDYALIL